MTLPRTTGQPDTDELLSMTLSVAVPLWIGYFQRLTDDERLAIAKEAGAHVAEHGDDILFKNTKGGATAKAFNHLARGLAALAYAPGGVTAFGLHFEAVP